MRRVLLVGPERFVLEEVPIPEPNSDEVVLRVQQSGICGSDVHIYRGLTSVKLPVVLGHEFAGIIHSVGSEVEGVRVGDRVTVEPGIQCGTCTYCQLGRYNLCRSQYTIGARYDHDGAYADFVRVPANKLVPMPEGMTFEVRGRKISPLWLC